MSRYDASALEATVRPLSGWPGPRTAEPKRNPFRRAGKYVSDGNGSRWVGGGPMPFSDTLSFLKTELRHLDARDINIEADFRERDIRQDGWPRSGARPASPAVILAFSSKHGPLQYACDTYDSWEANLRAIASTLEALRAVDRWGATQRHEQYQGFKKLPASTGPTMTVQAAADFLHAAYAFNCSPAGIIGDVTLARRAARQAKADTHPDRHNNDRAAWDRVQTALSVLSSHHGVSL